MKAGEVKGATGVSDAELREATRGFTLMLRRKRFSPQWIEENVNDLIGQAATEYAQKLAVGQPADNAVGWLINCAWRRNQNLLDSHSRKPSQSSLDDAFQLADESTPSPEEQAIELDRQERLRKAMSCLPSKERELLALVYFEDCSIREAGRILDWGKSAADRHHGRAMKRLRALVGDDRTLLGEGSIGIAATIASRDGRGLLDAALAPFRRAAASASELAGRVLPFSDTATAAATSSGASRALGYCTAGLMVVACGVGATGIVAPSLGGAEQKPPPKSATPEPARATVPEATPPASPTKSVPPSRTQAKPAPQAGSLAKIETATPSRANRAERRATASPSPAPAATPQETQSEFGIEGNAGTVESAPSPAPIAPAPSPARPATAAQAGSSSGSSSGSSGGSAAGNEFGL